MDRMAERGSLWSFSDEGDDGATDTVARHGLDGEFEEVPAAKVKRCKEEGRGRTEGGKDVEGCTILLWST